VAAGQDHREQAAGGDKVTGTGTDSSSPIAPEDLLARVDLVSPDELWGLRRGRPIRESSVRCGRPLLYPASEEDLPILIRRRSRAGGHRYYGMLLAFDLDRLPEDHCYTQVEFSVRLSDERIVAVGLEHDLAPPSMPLPRAAQSRSGWLDRLRQSGMLQVAVSGLQSPRFGWAYSDSAGGALEPCSYTMHAWLETPHETAEVAGTLRVEATISRTLFGYSARHAAESSNMVSFAEPLTGKYGVDEPGSVRLCAAVDVERYSRHPNERAERTQHRLVSVLERTLDHAQVNESQIEVQEQGDGRFIILPAAIDESKVIPAIVQGLLLALKEVNADLSQDARLRLRVALDRGLVKRGPNGYIGSTAINVHRLLDAAQTRKALSGHPSSDFALVVSDHLYRDVVSHGYGDLDPELFWKVSAEVSSKNFSEPAWLYVTPR
jgi:hypothetical protein